MLRSHTPSFALWRTTAAESYENTVRPVRAECGLNSVMTPVHTVASWARSADQGDVIIPGSRTTRFGQCSFCSSAPTMWSDLPSEGKNRVTSVDSASNEALRLGFLIVPTRNRRLWELCSRGALQVYKLINWLVGNNKSTINRSSGARTSPGCTRTLPWLISHERLNDSLYVHR